jgi:uncharacterized protein YlzI (FlbEa/FlbD family)
VLKLTKTNGDAIFINPLHLVSFDEYSGSTYLCLTNREVDSLSVKESPNQVWEMFCSIMEGKIGLR